MVENIRGNHSRVHIHAPYSGPDVPLRFLYQTFEFGDQDIHLRSLRDAQQFSDPDNEALALGISSANWALFGVVWDSSQVLARLMLEYEIAGKRILELGCGLALSSLLLNRRGADVTATDYHPEVAAYLRTNTELNKDSEIPYFRSSWDIENSTHGRFDLIIGSDILYERDNMPDLARFIHDHGQPQCEVVIVDPGRKQQGQFNQRMLQYGFTHTREDVGDTSFLAKPFSGSVLSFQRP